MSKNVPTYNSGVDAFCITIRQTSVLKIKRNLQLNLSKREISGWFTKKDAGTIFQNKNHIKKLMANGWVVKRVRSGTIEYRIKGETKWLKDNLQADFTKRRLSVSQKIWIYTIATEYCAQKNFKFDEEFSWAILVDSLLPLTSQQKIANLTKYSREAVNAKLKKNSHIKIINQHLKISDDVFSKFKTRESLKSYLAANNLKGYRVSFDGKLYRQIPNKYKIKHEIKYLRKTFEHQSRKLNKSVKSSFKIPNAGPLWVKKISLSRSARRGNKLFPNGSRRKGRGTIVTSESAITMMVNDKGVLKTLPSKLKKEVNRISTKMSLCSFFNKNKNLKFGKIKLGDFYEANNVEFKKFRYLLNSLQNETNKKPVYHSMRRTQRLSQDFNKAAVIMCKTA